jgi:ankyrin repeat protein
MFSSCGCRGLNINVEDKWGHTALWYAIKFRNNRAAITLIDKEADFKPKANLEVSLYIIIKYYPIDRSSTI